MFKLKLAELLKTWSDKLANLRVPTPALIVAEPVHFDDLTPIDNVAKGDSYKAALEWALQNKKIKNVAITGPYGSGKSSILSTFEREHPEYNYLNISLASFQDEESIVAAESIPGTVKPQRGISEKKTQEKQNEANQLIELSILQQMFYKVNDTDIPDSRFKRIRSLSDKQLRIYIWHAMLALTGLSVVIFPGILQRISWWDWLPGYIHDLVLLLAILMLILPGVALFKYVFRLFNTSKLNKLNLSSGEIEINPKSETSILNKHLDEILYFFQVTSYNVVVIEDLDRFNDPEIFTKLRELNILVNKSAQVGGRKIVFIYAIKDDMFKDKTRTKFFDFIIPIIPVINSSNSFEIMKKKLEKLKLKPKITDAFLSDITLYVDEMRTLKNIFNEFVIYYESLKELNIKPEKLFAMMVYKNIYPNDFAKLHSNEGIVFDVFQTKEILAEKHINTLKQKISEIKLKNQEIERFNMGSIIELRKLYVMAIHELIPNAVSLNLNGIKTFDQMTTKENFQMLKDTTNLQYYYHASGYSQLQNAYSGFSFKDIEEKADAKHSYQERKEIMRARTGNDTAVNLEEVSDLEHEITVLKAQTIKYLLSSTEDLTELVSADFAEQKLLVYLLRGGYIDESYPSFISYFYEGSLSKKDMVFVMSVKDRDGLDYRYALEKVEGMLLRLNDVEFTRPQVFNFNLLDHLLMSPVHKLKLNAVFLQLKSGTKKSSEFMSQYATHGKQLSKFIQLMAKSWTAFGKFVFVDSVYNVVERDKFLKLTLLHADLPDLDKLNKDEVITSYAESRPGFLTLFVPADLDRMKMVLKKLVPSFRDFETPKTAQLPLFTWIYENNYYRINSKMIQIILKVIGKKNEKNLGHLDTANYTTIRASGCTHLIAYIEANLDQYLEKVLLALPDNIQESADSVISLLNHPNISQEHKDKIIEKQAIVLQDIKAVETDQWPELLNHNMVRPEWHNVLEYFAHAGELDDWLIAFLNNPDNNKELVKIKTDSVGKPDELTQKYSKAFLLTEDIDNDTYETMLANFHYSYQSLDFSTLSDKKVEVLIKRHVIKLTPSHYKLLKENFVAHDRDLIRFNIDDFLKNVADYPLNAEDYKYLLEKGNYNEDTQLKIDDLITAEMVEAIPGLASHMSRIYSRKQHNALSFERLRGVLQHSTDGDAKAILLRSYLDRFDLAQIHELLVVSGKPFINLTEKGKSPKLDRTPINEAIVDILDRKKYVSSVKKEKEIMRINTFRK